MRTFSILVLMLASACTAPKVSSGVATTAVAQAAIQSDIGDIVARPSEVHWAVAGELAHRATVSADALVGGDLGGSLFYAGPDGEQVLPPVVRFAAAQAVQAGQADGALVTHYLVEETTDASGVTYEVTLAGRLLQLTDLGTLDGERADEVDALRLRYEAARDRLLSDD